MYVKTDGQENIHNFTLKFFVYLDLRMLMHLPSQKYKTKHDLSSDLRFPTMWYVWPDKAQTSLRIRPVWSQPLLVARIFFDF